MCWCAVPLILHSVKKLLTHSLFTPEAGDFALLDMTITIISWVFCLDTCMHAYMHVRTQSHQLGSNFFALIDPYGSDTEFHLLVELTLYWRHVLSRYWLLIFVFISIITSMARNSLLCADVPLRNYSPSPHLVIGDTLNMLIRPAPNTCQSFRCSRHVCELLVLYAVRSLFKLVLTYYSSVSNSNLNWTPCWSGLIRSWRHVFYNYYKKITHCECRVQINKSQQSPHELH